MSKAWIEDLWLTEPRETLPDGSKVKIPVPSSVTKSLAAYMKTPEKAKVPGKCFASMFVRQVRQCFSVVWADGFPRCRHRFPVM